MQRIFVIQNTSTRVFLVTYSQIHQLIKKSSSLKPNKSVMSSFKIEIDIYTKIQLWSLQITSKVTEQIVKSL